MALYSSHRTLTARNSPPPLVPRFDFKFTGQLFAITYEAEGGAKHDDRFERPARSRRAVPDRTGTDQGPTLAGLLHLSAGHSRSGPARLGRRVWSDDPGIASCRGSARRRRGARLGAQAVE